MVLMVCDMVFKSEQAGSASLHIKHTLSRKKKSDELHFF